MAVYTLQAWINFPVLLQTCCAISSKSFRPRWYLAAGQVEVRVDLKRSKKRLYGLDGAAGDGTWYLNALTLFHDVFRGGAENE